MQIALVKCSKWDADKDIVLLQNYLESEGHNVSVPAWTDDISWQDFDRIYISSCWDYYLNIAAYKNWLKHLKRLAPKTLTFNAPDTILWNLHKELYLKELEDRDVRIVPTQVITNAEEIESKLTPFYAAQSHYDDFVVKPSISASSYKTNSISSEKLISEAPAHICEILEDTPVLVQPLISDIRKNGEISLVFIDGDFCHAIVKTPQSGEFRCQSSFGGKVDHFQPSEELIETAKQILDKLPFEPPLYARIDGVETADGFLLMEVELNEPYLFLEHNPDTLKTLARCLVGSTNRS